MVAIVVDPLLQVPPGVALVKVVVNPTQTLAVPVIAAGSALTVTTVVDVHPPGNVYVIVAAPALTPETTPLDDPTTATDVVLLFQEPPPAHASVIVLPVQTFVGPVMGPGADTTLTVPVTLQPEDME